LGSGGLVLLLLAVLVSIVDDLMAAFEKGAVIFDAALAGLCEEHRNTLHH